MKAGGSVDVFLKELVWRDYAQNVICQFPEYGSKNARNAFDKLPWRLGKEADADLRARCGCLELALASAQVGRGTTFDVWMPRTAAAVSLAESTSPDLTEILTPAFGVFTLAIALSIVYIGVETLRSLGRDHDARGRIAHQRVVEVGGAARRVTLAPRQIGRAHV
mgnify:CR=1 FL=1